MTRFGRCSGPRSRGQEDEAKETPANQNGFAFSQMQEACQRFFLTGSNDLREVGDAAEATHNSGQQRQSLDAYLGVGIHHHHLLEESIYLRADGSDGFEGFAIGVALAELDHDCMHFVIFAQ
jgi:hypothetical protein